MINPFKALKRNRKRQQDLAWLVRAAFERGYLSGGGEWRDDWKETPERATLVRWGYIKEDDAYR